MLIETLLAAVAVIAAQSGPASISARNLVPQQILARPAQQIRKERIVHEGRDLLARVELKAKSYAPAPGQPSYAEIDAAKNQLKDALDSMSEMSEMDSLRLQMAMDRLSKMMTTLSNILKKAGDTDDAITSNIK